MSKTQEALKMVDSGIPPAIAAKQTGISRQAVDDALKRRAVQADKPVRQCSECGQWLPKDARVGALTCSNRCRTARARRLAKEKEARRRANINRERAALGLPPLG